MSVAPKNKICFLITGASGLIGQNLIRLLLSEGHQVKAVVRNPETFKLLNPEMVYKWNHTLPFPKQALQNTNVVINLAGAGIADKRWSAQRKKELYDSRVMGTKNLVTAINELSPQLRPQVLISGSAMGIYGSRGDEILTEESEVGADFLSDLCVQWEKAALQAENLRVILLRTGIVLAQKGGALAKMPPVVIGSGKDWMSWIHIQDVIYFILWAAENKTAEGPYNMVSPCPVTNKNFILAMIKAKKFPPFPLYTPKVFLKIVLGQLSSALIASVRVVPAKALAEGFVFKHSDIFETMKSLFQKK